MLEPKDYQKFIDEDINPGDYIVRELGGEYYVGRVVELSPNFYRYKVLNAFPLGEGVVRHEEAIKCYPTPLRKFKEGDEVICREHIGKWTVMEDEKDSVLVGIKDKCTGTIKAVTPASLLLIRPIDLHYRFRVIDGAIWDFKKNQSLRVNPSCEGTTEMERLCNLLNEIDKDEKKELDK